MTRPIPGPYKLTPEILVRAYAAGVFPMSEGRDDPAIFWVDPQLRGIIPLDGLHLSKSLRKVLRRDTFRVTVNTCFSDVIEQCAIPRPSQDDHSGIITDTWINTEIIRAYTELHHLGLAHSVEVWKDDVLVGGLYGIHLKGAFMGESMFSRCSNASKIALAHLVARLRLGGFALLDTQFITEHLASMGGLEISALDYQDRLEYALEIDGQFTGKIPVGKISSELDKMFSQSNSQIS
ncbi:MAG: leucyl/phenylalanyl-tRNA--protein transferase [Candidatus Lindowbacteria bacterium]|nr:leucyl/phenylalanyl-tRNA--protein transferase [Candidatus Lindowbacteria bacterium]